MPIGYARVSTVDRNPDLQRNPPTEAGCERIFTEQISGAVADRPELMAALNGMRRGDMLVGWKLGWLARSIKQHRIGECDPRWKMRQILRSAARLLVRSWIGATADSAGNGAVEFALIAPFLDSLVFGIA